MTKLLRRKRVNIVKQCPWGWRMKNPLKQVIIFTLCMILVIFLPAFPSTNATTLPNHVVINEFEQNPVGGDYNKQWVEIYNPTHSPVNVGNWKIVSATGTSKTIPVDTYVPANGYYVYTFSGTVLAHSNEMITLKDPSNVVVDVTAKKSSTTASASSWQRYPNGVDTNSDGDWQFRLGTEWKSNGGETVTLSISSSSITFGSDVTLSGTVDPAHVTLVRIQASMDGGVTWLNFTIVTSTSSGSYSHVVPTPDVGTYIFRSVLPWDSGVVSGTASLVVNKLSSQISVFAPKTVKMDESFSLTGFISPVRSSTPVTLGIGMPNRTYVTRSATTNAAGYFNYTFAPDAQGKWNVTASWSGDAETLGATSSIIFFNVEAADTQFLTMSILIVFPLVAALVIVLGASLGGAEKGRMLRFMPIRHLRPWTRGRLIPWRRRLLPTRVCLGCGRPLVYSSQFRRYYCSNCRRYI
jgi:hypothetical protein